VTRGRSAGDGRRLTRRGTLAALGGVGAVGSGLVGTAGAEVPSLTVATRNCYLGADLFRPLAAAMDDDQATAAAAGDLLTAVARSHVDLRLGAVADELARTEPDLVGVQEAALVRTGQPDGTPATDVRYDFRERLLAALDARGLPYRIVAATETTDVQLPATVDGERLAVRLTDRDLVLARDSVATSKTETDIFDAALTVTRDGRTVAVRRGYGAVEATVEGTRVTFCTAHLGSAAAEPRVEQAAELRDVLAGRPEPVVLASDLNSGPGAATAAYDRLVESFDDVADGGDTCCHAADLRNADPSLDSRIDHVLVRGDLRATAVERVGVDPDERVAVDGERLWPADHAGVVATLEASAATEPTPTATSTATPEATPTRTPTVADGTAAGTEAPGFGPALGVVSVLVAALATRRRDD
jgi:endonuclease/exonuclease/phosphatase family metal-dependent hydrolase